MLLRGRRGHRGVLDARQSRRAHPPRDPAVHRHQRGDGRRRAALSRRSPTSCSSRLEGRLFVAHNARFDYGFLRSEFRRLGPALPRAGAVHGAAVARADAGRARPQSRCGDGSATASPATRVTARSAMRACWPSSSASRASAGRRRSSAAIVAKLCAHAAPAAAARSASWPTNCRRVRASTSSTARTTRCSTSARRSNLASRVLAHFPDPRARQRELELVAAGTTRRVDRDRRGVRRAARRGAADQGAPAIAEPPAARQPRNPGPSASVTTLPARWRKSPLSTRPRSGGDGYGMFRRAGDARARARRDSYASTGCARSSSASRAAAGSCLGLPARSLSRRLCRQGAGCAARAARADGARGTQRRDWPFPGRIGIRERDWRGSRRFTSSTAGVTRVPRSVKTDSAGSMPGTRSSTRISTASCSDSSSVRCAVRRSCGWIADEHDTVLRHRCDRQRGPAGRGADGARLPACARSRGGVACEATLAQALPRLPRGRGVGLRVLWRIARVSGADAQRLYDGVREIDWSEHLDVGGHAGSGLLRQPCRASRTRSSARSASRTRSSTSSASGPGSGPRWIARHRRCGSTCTRRAARVVVAIDLVGRQPAPARLSRRAGRRAAQGEPRRRDPAARRLAGHRRPPAAASSTRCAARARCRSRRR